MIYDEVRHLGDFFQSSREKGRSGLPLLSVTLNNGLVARDTLERRTETTIHPDDHLLAREGFIVYNMMRVWQGALGRANTDGLVSPAYIVLKPTKKVDSLFAEYLFKTPRMVYLFWAYSYGLTKDRLRLYYNDFSRIPVIIPPLREQKKIAYILSTWDKAIITTEQLLANSLQQKKFLMQELLTGKKRLLSDEEVKFSGEWNIQHLSDLALVVMGSSPKSAAYNEEGLGLPLIQGNADIKKRKSSPRVYTSEITKECIPEDILLSVRAPVGTVALASHHACIGRGIAAIRAKATACQSFVYQWLLWFEPKWASFSQGSTFESINGDDIKQLKLQAPPYEEQQKIAAVLSTVDQEIESLQEKLDCLKNEKKALMQQLLTEKRREDLQGASI